VQTAPDGCPCALPTNTAASNHMHRQRRASTDRRLTGLALSWDRVTKWPLGQSETLKKTGSGIDFHCIFIFFSLSLGLERSTDHTNTIELPLAFNASSVSPAFSTDSPSSRRASVSALTLRLFNIQTVPTSNSFLVVYAEFQKEGKRKKRKNCIVVLSKALLPPALSLSLSSLSLSLSLFLPLSASSLTPSLTHCVLTQKT
jgi:hypothetical protein